MLLLELMIRLVLLLEVLALKDLMVLTIIRVPIILLTLLNQIQSTAPLKQ